MYDQSGHINNAIQHSKRYCAQGLLQYPTTKDNGTELYHELKDLKQECKCYYKSY